MKTDVAYISRLEPAFDCYFPENCTPKSMCISTMSISTCVRPTRSLVLPPLLLTQTFALSRTLALGLHHPRPSSFAFQPSALVRSILRPSLSLRDPYQLVVAFLGASIIWLKISPVVLARRSVKI